MLADTIAAIATGVGVAAVGVVARVVPRLSMGTASQPERLSLKEVESHRCSMGPSDPEETLDQALVVVMLPQLHGEDIVDPSTAACSPAGGIDRSDYSGARSADPGSLPNGRRKRLSGAGGVAIRPSARKGTEVGRPAGGRCSV